MIRLLMIAALCCLAPASRASDGLVTVVEGVRVLNGHYTEARYYYENNWAVWRRMALAEDVIHSWELVFADEDSDVPIILITRYRDAAQYAAAEERFLALMQRRDGGPRLLNEVPPGEFRERALLTIGPARLALASP